MKTFANTPPLNIPRGASSISDFCRGHAISRAFFYELEKRGQAPVTMKVGTRRLVSDEAAAAWRRRMEQAA